MKTHIKYVCCYSYSMLRLDVIAAAIHERGFSTNHRQSEASARLFSAVITLLQITQKDHKRSEEEGDENTGVLSVLAFRLGWCLMVPLITTQKSDFLSSQLTMSQKHPFEVRILGQKDGGTSTTLRSQSDMAALSANCALRCLLSSFSFFASCIIKKSY